MKRYIQSAFTLKYFISVFYMLIVFVSDVDMSNRRAVYCFVLAIFCFISWKHSIIGVTDSLKLAGRSLIFMGICTWLIYMLPRLKFLLFPVYQELPDSHLDESNRTKQEQARRGQQHQHNDKTSEFVERVLKPRQESLLRQNMMRSKIDLNWKLSRGFPVGGEEDQTCHDADESANEGARRRRRRLLEAVTQEQGPVQQILPKQKKVIVLPDEPSVDAEGVVKIALRCPGQRTVHRRFLKTWSSQLLLDWMMKMGYHPALYTLCMSYPRTEVLTAADVSLEEAGVLTDTLLNVEEKEPIVT